MKLKLSASEWPNGRCAILIKCIQLVSLADPEWCMKAGQRLFDVQHSFKNPLVVEVADPTYLSKLEAVCKEYGIALQIE